MDNEILSPNYGPFSHSGSHNNYSVLHNIIIHYHHIVIVASVYPCMYCTYTYPADIDACLFRLCICIQVLIDSSSIMTKEGKTTLLQIDSPSMSGLNARLLI